jgi:hypothetical protein
MIADPGPAPLPERMVELSMAHATYGPEAIAEVARLHNKSFPLSSGAAAMYGTQDSMIMLWVTGTPAQLLSRRMVDQMEATIAGGESPFTPVGVRQVDGRPVYELTGMGQQHYYFRSDELVVWLAADRSLAEAALSETLTFYP